MRNCFRVLLVVLLSSFAVAQNACFSLLNDSDVWLHCGSKEIRVTTTQDVTDFAVEKDGRYLAVERQHMLRRTKNTTFIDCSTSLYDLSSSRAIRETQHLCGQLYATCGTILLETRNKGVHDLVAGTQMTAAGYKRFVCSGNRSVVAGWPGESDKDLLVGQGSSRKLAAVAGDASVNDAGQIAYWTESSNANSVCVATRSNNPVCLNEADAFGRISISESGEVLFNTHTEGSCWYRKGRVVRAQSPGGGDDQCLGIALWRPGSTKVIVRDLVRRPQWLSVSAAAAVRRCSTSKHGCVPPK